MRRFLEELAPPLGRLRLLPPGRRDTDDDDDGGLPEDLANAPLLPRNNHNDKMAVDTLILKVG